MGTHRNSQMSLFNIYFTWRKIIHLFPRIFPSINFSSNESDEKYQLIYRYLWYQDLFSRNLRNASNMGIFAHNSCTIFPKNKHSRFSKLNKGFNKRYPLWEINNFLSVHKKNYSIGHRLTIFLVILWQTQLREKNPGVARVVSPWE